MNMIAIIQSRIFMSLPLSTVMSFISKIRTTTSPLWAIGMPSDTRPVHRGTNAKQSSIK